MMMQRNKILIGVLVVLVLVGVYFAFDRENNITNNNTNISTTTDNNASSSPVITGNGNYTIEQVPIEEGSGIPQPIPDLNRSIIVSSNAMVTPEATASATPNIKSLQEKLKTDPANFNNWIALGINQKEAGDFEGAKISWEYASKLAPSDYISLGNLGNLYAYFIKDTTKAEMYYKQAISRSPLQANLYIQLADVYTTILSDRTKAREIIDEGLAKLPNDPNLLQIKASLN